MTPPRDPAKAAECLRVYREIGTFNGGAKSIGMNRMTFKRFVQDAMANPQSFEKLDAAGYDTDAPERTAVEAWDDGAAVFDREMSRAKKNQWTVIKRADGPFVIFHTTDEHVDDNCSALRLIEADIKAADELDAIKCHGGDALNNWPMAGRLAKKWADQECSLPDSLLRMQHFFDLLQPHVATQGNHEEMNPYLAQIVDAALPLSCIRDYWSVNFRVETPSGRPLRAVLSHKFAKGSSWFHYLHGHIREMLQAAEADLFMDGHLHSDGTMDHTLQERGYAATLVASGGYKVLDKFASRISRGGKYPKLRGRCHWIVCDPSAEFEENFCMPFKSARQAEAYLNGLQNLKAA